MSATSFAFLSLLVLKTAICSPQPAIIVVGAGPSGVAAATRLLANNFTNITVLEAEPRIGGRIHSVPFGEAYVDLGARRCHGEEGNVVFSLVKDLDLLRHSGSQATVYSSRYAVSSEFSQRLIGLIWDVYHSNNTGVEESAQEFYARRYPEAVSATITDPTERTIALSAGRLLTQLILSLRGSFNLNNVILNRDYRTCPGDLRLNWNGSGYRTILDVLIRRIPDPSQQLPFDEKLQLNKEVTNVNWDVESGAPARVTCSDGSVYSADHVIFTPSVGVLKHDHWKLFTPTLPEAKRTAIEDIGLGAIVDYSFYFPESWWALDGGFSGYYFVWDTEDANQAVEEYQNLTQSNLSVPWIRDVFYVEPAPKNPNVLTFWIVGENVPQVEHISDEELANGTYFVLNKFLGRYHNVSHPTQLIRSRWYSNPHFRGVYSYQTQRAHNRRPSTEVELSLSLANSAGHPVLQFAGEATHSHYYSTVHGAIETGFREADRIIQLHQHRQ